MAGGRWPASGEPVDRDGGPHHASDLNRGLLMGAVRSLLVMQPGFWGWPSKKTPLSAFDGNGAPG